MIGRRRAHAMLLALCVAGCASPKIDDEDRAGHDLPGRVPRIELGLPWVDVSRATEAWQIRYDNVLIEVEPT